MTRTIDDWRAWIAENLLLDMEPTEIARVLVGYGLTPEDAVEEVNAALSSPYIQGGTRLKARLAKRDWMLSVYSHLSRNRASGDKVERRAKLSRRDFFEQYYNQNRPVLITGMFENWPARSKWSFDYFRETAGDALVEVQFGRESDPEYEINNRAHKKKMPFREYLDLVESSGKTNDFYMTANNTSHNRKALDALYPDVGPITEYLDPAMTDTGFFWVGPAGTKTPFHHDLTNNFMAQVIGRKKVKLIGMHDTAHVYNDRFCYSQVDGSNIDYERFPEMKHAQVIECTVGPGELLFVPIGWWHYVEGLDASVMMSFTNFLQYNDYHQTYTSYDGV